MPSTTGGGVLGVGETDEGPDEAGGERKAGDEEESGGEEVIGGLIPETACVTADGTGVLGAGFPLALSSE